MAGCVVHILPLFLTSLLWLISVNASLAPQLLRVLGPQGVNLWKLDGLQTESKLFLQDSNSDGYNIPSTSEFLPQWFEQPLDHFSNSTGDTFRQRFWVNTRHYKGVGPVILLDGGETSGKDRIPFLDTGIVDILAKATGGLGVVLEHRYYGKSIPVLNLSTDSLRWLNNAQSAADSANFMAHVKFDGIDQDITAPNTPWIYYGGSYAGARAAHMRILYPELVYGAIASSAVTHATLSNWEYMEVIRQAADPKCSAHLSNSIETIDNILRSGGLTKPLKALFGLADLEHDEDFASVIGAPLGSWQAQVWDPAVGSTRFDEFCTALSKPPFGRLHGSEELPYGNPRRLVTLPGGLSLDFALLNYAQYIKQHVVSQCPKGWNAEECFGTFDEYKYRDTSLDETWRLWLFQVCTEWGYFTTAPPDQKRPRIISRLITLEYESRICPQAFPPGKYFTIPAMPNITAVNSLGDFAIAADRLAFIDGEVDPWRPDTPHSEYAEDREDTILRPFKLIPNAVHHYDEYGLKNISEEPYEIRKIHGEMILFVTEWLKDWEAPKKSN